MVVIWYSISRARFWIWDLDFDLEIFSWKKHKTVISYFHLERYLVAQSVAFLSVEFSCSHILHYSLAVCRTT